MAIGMEGLATEGVDGGLAGNDDFACHPRRSGEEALILTRTRSRAAPSQGRGARSPASTGLAQGATELVSGEPTFSGVEAALRFLSDQQHLLRRKLIVRGDSSNFKGHNFRLYFAAFHLMIK